MYIYLYLLYFCFNDTATTEIYTYLHTLSLHDALPISNAQAASNDRQWTTAYAIASRVDDAYAAGTDIRDQSLGERDDYTSLVWLAGTTAYYELKRPKDAMAMFQRYAEAARSPQTISKGYYWAGRAAPHAGDATPANLFLVPARAHAPHFYRHLPLARW